MISYIYYFLGFSITLFVIIDLLWTALWVDGGAGPLSDRLTTFVWRMVKKIDNDLLYNIVGPVILSSIILSWFFLMWLGVTLFFAGDPQSIVNTSTNAPITWFDRFYFTGFTLFTLGIGDLTPQAGFFQIVTALVSGLGMMVLTFGASYIISVVGAVVEERAFSRSVSGLGANSQELLKKIWNGKDFYQFDLLLSSINSQITQLTQQNQAFPLLQYYHSEDPEKNSSINIVVLDEALSFLEFGLKDKELVNSTLVRATRSTITNYLKTITSGYGNQVKDVTDTPPTLDLSPLKETTIPIVSQDDYSEELKIHQDRRNQLLTILNVDNHEWPN